jgi:hypothetical protein
MQSIDLGSTLMALLLVVVVFGMIFLWADGLALFAPKSTKRIAASAQGFCSGRCRLVDGRCPLSGSTEPAANCPLWRFVDADLPTAQYGSPFEHLWAKRSSP